MRHTERLSGELLIIFAAVLFAVSSTFCKLAVNEMPPLQAIWIRFTLPAMVLLLAAWRGWIPFAPRRPWYHIARALVTGCGVVLGFTAVGLTSFSNFTVLTYTYPILGTLISTLYFREPFKPRHLLALVLTFLGVFLIMRPSWNGIRLGDALALFSAVFYGCSLAIVREATKTESVWLLTLSFYLGASLLSAPVTLPHFSSFSPTGLWLILGMIGIGTAAQLLETSGFRRCSVAVGGALSYLTVVIAIALGVWLFHEPLSPSFLAGAAIIVGCGIYLVAKSDLRYTN